MKQTSEVAGGATAPAEAHQEIPETRLPDSRENQAEGSSQVGAEWPQPLRSEALYGPIGDFVTAMEGKTEADPVAILLGGLVAFGNLVGRGPHYRIGGAGGGIQYPNLNALVIGGSASGRKGTAWSEVEALFRVIDADWARNSIRSGLSSGEGLIHAVRDRTFETESTNEVGPEMQGVSGEAEVVRDPGIDDKRLLVREPEFGRVLDVAKRTGNTITGQIRELWDSGRSATMTRSNPIQTTEAHVSLIADVTPEELRKKLAAVDQVNGFLNRFIPVVVKRHGSLPYPEDLDEGTLRQIAYKLRQAAGWASECGGMSDDLSTRPIWTKAHERLADDQPPPLGPILARASVHVRRLAMVFALADRTNVIKPPHMEAAIALWDYSEASARHVFQLKSAPSLTLEQKILTTLRQAAPKLVTYSRLREAVGTRVKRAEIDVVLRGLESQGIIESATEQAEGHGRMTVQWRMRSDSTFPRLRTPE